MCPALCSEVQGSWWALVGQLRPAESAYSALTSEGCDWRSGLAGSLGA